MVIGKQTGKPVRSDHFGFLLLKCAPPFPNTIPLTSSASRIARTISDDTALVPNSKLVTVETPTPAAFASSVCFIFNSARPARHWDRIAC
jgi:hypothetical protein